MLCPAGHETEGHSHRRGEGACKQEKYALGEIWGKVGNSEHRRGEEDGGLCCGNMCLYVHVCVYMCVQMYKTSHFLLIKVIWCLVMKLLKPEIEME